jgi:cyclomaltodextrinase
VIAAHNRREAIYRTPYGAVPTASSVTLRVRVAGVTEQLMHVRLCYMYGLYEFYRTVQPMRQADICDDDPTAVWYEYTLQMADEANLFFYWFELKTATKRRWLIPDDESTCGAAKLVRNEPNQVGGSIPVTNAFQITVYRKDFTVPEWFLGSVMYQIFPDRFYRGSRVDPAVKQEALARDPDRIWHDDWDEEVDIKGKGSQGYMALDFYGGTLAGIEEKLDYIASLGVTVLYLNPIFEARSNHRYDTGDYEKIDPILGSAKDFTSLAKACRERGIRIILDGVFSHTGADSRYFNRYGRYEGNGAWQAMQDPKIQSDYSSWYRFEQRGHTLFYDSWWGFEDLPNVNEYDLEYRRYITGSDGVIARWLGAGADGFRLDVSDELPDGFIRSIRRAVRRAKDDAVVLGEIWEDASAKVSYGNYRDFLFGRTHDAVMGYPFQRALLGWLRYEISTSNLTDALETIRENYPLPAFYANMNLLGSHDTPRAVTVLAGDPDPGARDAQGRLFLSEKQRERGLKLLSAGFVFMTGFPGNMSIYYGDEKGLEGYRDPYNRRTFPWDRDGSRLLRTVQTLGRLKTGTPVLATGDYCPVYEDDAVFMMKRFLTDGRDVFGKEKNGPSEALIAVNRDDSTRTISLDGLAYTVPARGGVILLDGTLVFTTESTEPGR